MLAVQFRTPSAQLRNCCRHSSTRTPVQDGPRGDQAAIAKRAPREYGLFRGVLMKRRVYAASSFPVANNVPGRERSLDPTRWRADKAARSVSTWSNPPRRRTDHALARRRGRPRRFPSASASSAFPRQERVLPLMRWQFHVPVRSGLRKRQSHRGRNRWPKGAHRCWHRSIAHLRAPGFLIATLPSRMLETLSALPMSRRLVGRPRYCITDVREITLRSPIFDKFVSTSSWMPSAK